MSTASRPPPSLSTQRRSSTRARRTTPGRRSGRARGCGRRATGARRRSGRRRAREARSGSSAERRARQRANAGSEPIIGAAYAATRRVVADRVRGRYALASWPPSRRGSSVARSRSPTSRRSASGCSPTATPQATGAADVAVINTCCVTNEAVAKSRQAAAQAARTHARVYVTGCAANLSEAAFAGLPENVRVVAGGARSSPTPSPPTSARSAASRRIIGSSGCGPSSRSRTAARSPARSA